MRRRFSVVSHLKVFSQSDRYQTKATYSSHVFYDIVILVVAATVARGFCEKSAQNIAQTKFCQTSEHNFFSWKIAPTFGLFYVIFIKFP
jgi:hypothetical protein